MSGIKNPTQIIKYTDYEGGEWIEPTGEFAEEEVRSLPLHKTYRGYVWGWVHSYVRKDGKRFDAYNDGFCKGEKVLELLT